MNKYNSKDHVRMKQYNIMLKLARDKTSTLYNTDGSQRTGATHRSLFWRGYNGTFEGKFSNLAPHPSCIIYCCWRAGIDFKAYG